ncbi:CD59 glycoprotein isoform X1 [Protobothrops mucrosquamatus]|uniref:CD59 glycoprotein isoform X1 n=1 Tax=Protobothrops mucrosquamatus TaxID=103944 RepID=UPI000775FAD1|nr:CD59 glycoprotein isoform X1 [Protobothrops mucrosquamatus]
MKSLLVTAGITAFVLALFLHSGSALVCYNCESAMCNKTMTCTVDQNTCITVHYGVKHTSQCWKYSDCNVDFISYHLSINNFKYRCCNWDFCNNVPNVASKIALSGAFLLIVAHILKFLVWN